VRERGARLAAIGGAGRQRADVRRARVAEAPGGVDGGEAIHLVPDRALDAAHDTDPPAQPLGDLLVAERFGLRGVVLAAQHALLARIQRGGKLAHQRQFLAPLDRDGRVAVGDELLQLIWSGTLVAGAHGVVATLVGATDALDDRVPDHALEIARRAQRRVVAQRGELDRVVDDQLAHVQCQRPRGADLERQAPEQLVAPADQLARAALAIPRLARGVDRSHAGPPASLLGVRSWPTNCSRRAICHSCSGARCALRAIDRSRGVAAAVGGVRRAAARRAIRAACSRPGCSNSSRAISRAASWS
jgi:hypothetical protein